MALIDFSYHLKGNTHEIEDLYFLLFCCIKHGCGNCFPAPVATFTHSLQKLLRKMHSNLLALFAQNLFFFLKCGFLVTKQGAKATEIKLKLKPTCFLFLFPLSVFVFAATHKHKSSYLTVCFAACWWAEAKRTGGGECSAVWKNLSLIRAEGQQINYTTASTHNT